jgi:hypothetical protein
MIAMKYNYLSSKACAIMIASAMISLVTNSCQKKPSAADPEKTVKSVSDEINQASIDKAKGGDIPILPLTVQDFWLYDVKIQIPAGVQHKDSPAVNQSFERKRSYIGKVKPGADYPDTGCFEIEAKGTPVEREYVDINDERVMMRGSGSVGSAEIKPLWLDPGVLLVRAGLLGGETLPPIEIKDPASGAVVRRLIQIIGRESIETAGKKFNTIRILMTGTDGGMELRRTIWFAPHYGIVKEEKSRFINDQLVLKETSELKEFRVALAKD